VMGSRGFGTEVRDAMDRRVEHLVGEGLARRRGQRVIFARDLLNTLRGRELSDVTRKIAAETGLVGPRRRASTSLGSTGSGYLEFRPICDDR